MTYCGAKTFIMLIVSQEFMGRTIRVARSKRFLREETKAAIEPDTSAVS